MRRHQHACICLAIPESDVSTQFVHSLTLQSLRGGIIRSVQCTLYTVHCTVYTVLCTLWFVQCTLYIVGCSVKTLHFKLCTEPYLRAKSLALQEKKCWAGLAWTSERRDRKHNLEKKKEKKYILVFYILEYWSYWTRAGPSYQVLETLSGWWENTLFW